jgi:uncharacterized membrane protein
MGTCCADFIDENKMMILETIWGNSKRNLEVRSHSWFTIEILIFHLVIRCIQHNLLRNRKISTYHWAIISFFPLLFSLLLEMRFHHSICSHPSII